MKRCCAVLVNYFGAVDTAGAALSVLGDAPDTSLVVVDNSNDQDEHTLLRSLLPRAAHVIDAGENLGFGGACNLAWKNREEEFMLFVNPDVRLLPGCVSALTALLARLPSVAAVAPRQYLDAACQWLLPPAWLPTALRAWTHEKALRNGRGWRRLALAARAEHLQLWQADSALQQRAVSGGVFMLRRDALSPGEDPFDPRFFMYFEDSDLCMRLRMRGAVVMVEPAAKAVHAWRNLPHKAPLMAEAAATYFAKYDPAGCSPWHAKARQLTSAPPDPGAWPVFNDWPTDQGMRVPVALQSGWLLELALSPLFQTVIGRFGSGGVIEEPTDVLALLGAAEVFGRLGPQSKIAADGSLPLYFRWRADRGGQHADTPR